MKTICIQIIQFATLGALFIGVNAVYAQGTAFTYQGRLNVNGATASGIYDFRYRLALDPNGNNYFGSSVLASGQVISNGLFTATLDFGAGAFNGGNYWLEVDVRTNGAGGYTALNPLQPVTPAPYAIFSGTSGNALNATAAATATTATTATTASAVGANGVNGVAIQNNAVTSPKIAGGQVVKSLTAGVNTLYDNVTLAAGNNVTITPSGQTLTIAATGGQSWSLAGNSGTTPGSQFVGTTDNQPLEFRVNGQRALRLEPDASVTGAPNVIGGSSNNIVDAGVVGSFIGGGGAGNLGGSGSTNRISANFCVIGGGVGNTIQTNTTGSYGTGSTIGGGWQNTIQTNCQVSTIAGGSGNIIQTNTYGASIGGGVQNIVTPNSYYGTVPGGVACVAGNFAFAAGTRAKATNQGAFVWSDSRAFDFASINANEFAIRCTGGARFVSGVWANDGTTFSGVSLPANGTAWATLSDRNAKKDFKTVETVEVLEKLVRVPVTQWHYKWESDLETANIGPMAQDFIQAFYPGRNDKRITTLEFDGVELAAIQGLNQKIETRLKQKDDEIETLKVTTDELKQRLLSLEQILKSQHSSNP